MVIHNIPFQIRGATDPALPGTSEVEGLDAAMTAEAMARESGDTLAYVAVNTEAALTAALSAQASATSGLDIEFTADVTSGGETYVDGQVAYVPPMSQTIHRRFVIPRDFGPVIDQDARNTATTARNEITAHEATPHNTDTTARNAAAAVQTNLDSHEASVHNTDTVARAANATTQAELDAHEAATHNTDATARADLATHEASPHNTDTVARNDLATHETSPHNTDTTARAAAAAAQTDIDDHEANHPTLTISRAAPGNTPGVPSAGSTGAVSDAGHDHGIDPGSGGGGTAGVDQIARNQANAAQTAAAAAQTDIDAHEAGDNPHGIGFADLAGTIPDNKIPDGIMRDAEFTRTGVISRLAASATIVGGNAISFLSGGNAWFSVSLQSVITAITTAYNSAIGSHDGRASAHSAAIAAHDDRSAAHAEAILGHNRDPQGHGDIRDTVALGFNVARINGTTLTLVRADNRVVNLSLPTSGGAVADGVITSASLDPATETITLTTSTNDTIELDLSPGLLKYALDTDIDADVVNLTFSANGQDVVLTKHNGDIVTRPLPITLRHQVFANPTGMGGVDITRIQINGTDYNIPVGSVVVANPSGTGGADLTRISIAGTSYNIPSGGGGSGTAVVANPSGTDGVDLNRVSIAGTNYNIPDGGSGTTVDPRPSGSPTASLGKVDIAGTLYRIGARLNPLGQRRAATQLTSLRVITDSHATQDGIIAGPNGAIEANRGTTDARSRLEYLTVGHEDFYVQGLDDAGDAPTGATVYTIGDYATVNDFRYLCIEDVTATAAEIPDSGSFLPLSPYIRTGYTNAETYVHGSIIEHNGVPWYRTATGTDVTPGSETADAVWDRLVTGRRVTAFPDVAAAQHATTYYHDTDGAAIRRAGDRTRAVFVPAELPTTHGAEAVGYVEEFRLGLNPKKIGRWVTDQPAGLIDLYEFESSTDMFTMVLILDSTSAFNDAVQTRLRFQVAGETQNIVDVFPQASDPQEYRSAEYGTRVLTAHIEHFVSIRPQHDSDYLNIHSGDEVVALIDEASVHKEFTEIESDVARLEYLGNGIRHRALTQSDYDDLPVTERGGLIFIVSG